MDQAVSARDVSRNRLVVCICDLCRRNDPHGSLIAAHEKATHERNQAYSASAISRRGKDILIPVPDSHGRASSSSIRSRGRGRPVDPRQQGPVKMPGLTTTDSSLAASQGHPQLEPQIDADRRDRVLSPSSPLFLQSSADAWNSGPPEEAPSRKRSAPPHANSMRDAILNEDDTPLLDDQGSSPMPEDIYDDMPALYDSDSDDDDDDEDDDDKATHFINPSIGGSTTAEAESHRSPSPSAPDSPSNDMLVDADEYDDLPALAVEESGSDTEEDDEEEGPHEWLVGRPSAATALPASPRAHPPPNLPHQPAPPIDESPREARLRLPDVYAQSHDVWYIRVLLTLVAVLHTTHHVSFRACALVLFTLNSIFVLLGILPLSGQMPVTLHTVINRLDITDKFTIHPICKGCHRIYAPGIAADSICKTCRTPLFKKASPFAWRRLATHVRPSPTPVSAAPIHLLSDQLADMLSRRPDIEAQCDEWKSHRREPGQYSKIMDGNVWHELKGPDGKKFFDADNDSDELRIGTTLSIDWCERVLCNGRVTNHVYLRYGRKTSVYGPSHSSGVASFCISNLREATRYRAGNLIIAYMTPGPTEPTAEQLQHYNKIIVDDLIMLYEHGVFYRSEKYPNGRRARVGLLGIVCDHPAMCKMCGHADHSHKVSPCPKCKVPLSEIYSDKSLRNEYPPRSGDEHRENCYKWKSLKTAKDRTDFFTTHGARWTEFARLTYFDLVRYTIIDPMHNILLGLAKTQWYSVWIQGSALRTSTDKKARELDVIHRFLETFESPLWAGKLPMRVGEPSGGNLTADEYKFSMTVPLAIVVPIVWETFIEESQDAYDNAMNRHEKAMDAYKVALSAWNKNPPPPPPAGKKLTAAEKKRHEMPTAPKKPKLLMQKDEPVNFLRFATSIKILLSSSITHDMIEYALKLLQEYLLEFRTLYGEGTMKPNHHWSVHTPEQIRDYGPVYNFWCFLSERLNESVQPPEHSSMDVDVEVEVDVEVLGITDAELMERPNEVCSPDFAATSTHRGANGAVSARTRASQRSSLRTVRTASAQPPELSQGNKTISSVSEGCFDAIGTPAQAMCFVEKRAPDDVKCELAVGNNEQTCSACADAASSVSGPRGHNIP
ncbi:hypothetical protein PLICRDRAFT_571426 [Plicaturopsis crispa FD-325 SS-3]|nr:hypothetical protein PLICRDRAFT_571426 [Plicaturopsis crispa FD-325 SS-3]